MYSLLLSWLGALLRRFIWRLDYEPLVLGFCWIPIPSTKGRYGKTMKTYTLKLWLLAMLLAPTVRSVAQTASPESKETPQGFTEVEAFQGTVNSDVRLLKLDSTLGWDFNRHFSVFAG